MVYGIEENGQEVGLCAEVFLDKAEVEAMGITDIADRVKADIKTACAPLPIYKQIAKVVVRKNEFTKTTTNKIRRQAPENKTLDN